MADLKDRINAPDISAMLDDSAFLEQLNEEELREIDAEIPSIGNEAMIRMEGSVGMLPNSSMADEDLAEVDQQIPGAVDEIMEDVLEEKLAEVDQKIPESISEAVKELKMEQELSGVENVPGAVDEAMEELKTEKELSGVENVPGAVDEAMEELKTEKELSGVDIIPGSINEAMEELKTEKELSGVENVPGAVDETIKELKTEKELAEVEIIPEAVNEAMEELQEDELKKIDQKVTDAVTEVMEELKTDQELEEVDQMIPEAVNEVMKELDENQLLELLQEEEKEIDKSISEAVKETMEFPMPQKGQPADLKKAAQTQATVQNLRYTPARKNESGWNRFWNQFAERAGGVIDLIVGNYQRPMGYVYSVPAYSVRQYSTYRHYYTGGYSGASAADYYRRADAARAYANMGYGYYQRPVTAYSAGGYGYPAGGQTTAGYAYSAGGIYSQNPAGNVPQITAQRGQVVRPAAARGQAAQTPAARVPAAQTFAPRGQAVQPVARTTAARGQAVQPTAARPRGTGAVRRELGDLESMLNENIIQVEAGGSKIQVTPSHYQSLLQIYKTPEEAVKNYSRYRELKDKDEKSRSREETEELAKLEKMEELAGRFDQSHQYMLQSKGFRQSDVDYAFYLEDQEKNGATANSFQAGTSASGIYQSLFFESVFSGMKDVYLGPEVRGGIGEDAVQSLADGTASDDKLKPLTQWLTDYMNECAIRKESGMRTILRGIIWATENPTPEAVVERMYRSFHTNFLRKVFPASAGDPKMKVAAQFFEDVVTRMMSDPSNEMTRRMIRLTKAELMQGGQQRK